MVSRRLVLGFLRFSRLRVKGLGFKGLRVSGVRFRAKGWGWGVSKVRACSMTSAIAYVILGRLGKGERAASQRDEWGGTSY